LHDEESKEPIPERPPKPGEEHKFSPVFDPFGDVKLAELNRKLDHFERQLENEKDIVNQTQERCFQQP
jgi:hypothetical protein